MQITTPDHVLFRELDGEAVLLDLKRQQYFGLNEIGTRVWAALRDGMEPEAIVAGIVADYETETAQAEADVARLIEELISAELIEVHDVAAD